MFETMIKNQTAKQAKELAAWMARREETVALPEGVWRTEDIAYLEDALPCHRMDLYQPIQEGPARPVLLNLPVPVHGPERPGLSCHEPGVPAGAGGDDF